MTCALMRFASTSQQPVPTPYSSIAEFVAERFHTSVAFLAELNRGKNLDRLAPGDAVQVPNVAPLEIESLKPAEDIPP